MLRLAIRPNKSARTSFASSDAMRRIGKVITYVAVVLAVAYVAFKLKYPDYTYRYRLQLSIEVDGKIHTGSSVIEVVWNGGPNLEFGGVYSAGGKVRGQAPIIDLGDRGVVVASLISDDRGGPAAGTEALALGARAFGSDSSVKELPGLVQLTGRRDLQPNNWPRLLWLPGKPRPPRAIAFVHDDLARQVGGQARFVEAFVEMTDDPVIIDIDKRLPWFRAWRDEIAQKKSQDILPNPTTIAPYMLVRN
jgi:hypothetical protein